MRKPNYADLGFATTMGPKLRKVVEDQLVIDLRNYGVDNPELRFDWSESCIEGKCTDYLDGSIDRFSGISIFDSHDNIVAEGWMEFIQEGDLFLVYWDTLSTFQVNKRIGGKQRPGIPDHIWAKIPDDIKPTYFTERKRGTTT